MIRRATIEDIPEIVALGAEFLAYSPHRWIPLDREAFANTARAIIEGAGAIFLSDDGFIGGALSPMYFNPAYVIAAELFWYAKSEGQALRDAFEAWAREAGAAAVACSGLVDEREKAIRRVYARAGYEASEVAFMKRFN